MAAPDFTKADGTSIIVKQYNPYTDVTTFSPSAPAATSVAGFHGTGVSGVFGARTTGRHPRELGWAVGGDCGRQMLPC